MVVATAVVTMLIVFAIAAGAIGREAQKLDAVPARPVFDPDEATTWIAERLPPQVTATLSYAELGYIVQWTLDLLRQRAAVARTSGEVPDAGETAVIDVDSAADHAITEAMALGLDLHRQDVRAAVEQVLVYLETIGAIGPEADA
ncbi:MAG: hypothetical protein QOK28_3418 [Actinomycetota bacterium]